MLKEELEFTYTAKISLDDALAVLRKQNKPNQGWLRGIDRNTVVTISLQDENIYKFTIKRSAYDILSTSRIIELQGTIQDHNTEEVLAKAHFFRTKIIRSFPFIKTTLITAISILFLILLFNIKTPIVFICLTTVIFLGRLFEWAMNIAMEESDRAEILNVFYSLKYHNP